MQGYLESTASPARYGTPVLKDSIRLKQQNLRNNLQHPEEDPEHTLNRRSDLRSRDLGVSTKIENRSKRASSTSKEVHRRKSTESKAYCSEALALECRVEEGLSETRK